MKGNAYFGMVGGVKLQDWEEERVAACYRTRYFACIHRQGMTPCEAEEHASRIAERLRREMLQKKKEKYYSTPIPVRRLKKTKE